LDCAHLSLIPALLAWGLWVEVPPSGGVLSLRRDYPATKASVASQRERLGARYREASSAQEREAILRESALLVEQTLAEKVLPAWLGTPWAFFGATRTPGEGQIACGTFVVYTMQDVGFRIPSRMAAQPSENIAKNLAGTSRVRRFSNHAPMNAVGEWIRQNGEGVFLVGLDVHVGFIIHRKGRLEFCHSSYYRPPLAVVSQDLLERSPLTDSGYRVLARLLTEDMMVKWLQGETFPVTYDHFRR
jgi:hypothetical protein